MVDDKAFWSSLIKINKSNMNDTTNSKDIKKKCKQFDYKSE
jgi:hypothetical protein